MEFVGNTVSAVTYVHIYFDWSAVATVRDNSVTVADGFIDFDFDGGAHGAAFEGNTLRAKDDGDAGTAGNVPYIEFGIAGMPARIAGNPRIHADAHIRISNSGWGATGPGESGFATLTVEDNPEIRAGSYVDISNENADLVLTGNDAILAENGNLGVHAVQGDLFVADNAFEAADGSVSFYTDAADAAASADVLFRGNSVAVHATDAFAGSAHGAEVRSSYGDLRVDGNAFRVRSADPESTPYLRMTGTMTGAAGSCTITGTSATVAAVDATVAASAALTCGDVDGVGENAFEVSGNEVTVAGAAESTIAVDVRARNGGTLSLDGNTFTAPAASGVTISQ
jgi:hypothetical protein